MSQQLLTTGIKINVDATDLDIKFAKSADALNKTLTKSQKALGLFYDEQGRLVNSTGQVVEGLSQAQIKLGYYVDELGQTRTYQGGFTEGLNASQKALGWFSDEVGNVYDRLGRLVIESKRASDSFDDLERSTREAEAAQRKYDDALSEMSNAANSALGSLGSLGGQTAQLFATIQAATGENDAFTSSIIAAGEGVSVFVDTYGAVSGVMQYMDALRRATAAQTAATQAASVAQNGLNVAMKANPVGIVVAGVAALTAAVATYKSTVQDAATDSVGAFAEIEAAAKRAGDAIKSAADVAKYGFANQTDPGAEYKTAFDKAQNAQIAKDRSAGALANTKGFWGVVGAQLNVFAEDDENQTWGALFGTLRKERAEAYADANDRYNEAANEYLALQSQMIAKARDSVQTESQKLEAEKRNYEALLANAKGSEEEATITAYIKTLDEKIAAAKEKEVAASRKPISEEDYSLDSGALADAVASGRYTLEEAQEAYQGALEREAAKLDELGITDLFKEAENAKTPLEKLADQTQALDDAYKAGIISQEKYNKGLEAIDAKRAETQKAIDDEAKNKKRADLGLDAALDAAAQSKADKENERVAALSPEARYDEAIAKYSNALSEGTITQEEYNTLAAHAAETKAAEIEANEKALEREREEERARVEKERADLRKESGIDALIESLKSPYEKYLDKLDGINNYLSKGAVTSAEAQLLAEQAYMEAEQAYLDASSGANSKLGQALAKPVATAKDGSAELYKMQLAQQNDKTAQMIAVQKEVLSSSQNMALYMFNMQRDIAMMATGWPGYYGG